MIICYSLDNSTCTPRCHQEPCNPSPLHEIKVKLTYYYVLYVRIQYNFSSSSYIYEQGILYLQPEYHNQCKTCQHRNSPGSQGCKASESASATSATATAMIGAPGSMGRKASEYQHQHRHQPQLLKKYQVISTSKDISPVIIIIKLTHVSASASL